MKLHLGCGKKKIEGFVNVDIIEHESVDIVDDVSKLSKFNNETADLIYACHVLEHFKRREYFDVLKRWTDILKEGGMLRISVPDFAKVAKVYCDGLYPLDKLLGNLQGGQTYMYNFHFMNFDFNILKRDLEKLGYEDIHIWDWRKTEHSGVDDYSQAYLPHMDKEKGILMSLNIEATKKISHIENTKISILLATYNGKKYIEKAIESVLYQKYNNWELLIGLNGTVDGTQIAIKKYLNDDRIKVFDYGSNKGKAKTLNKLLKEATGEFCAVHDDDDTWLPKKLSEQVNYVNEYDIIGTQIIYVDENENYIGMPRFSLEHNDILQRSLEGINQIANTSAIFRKSKAVEVGGWDEEIDGMEDYDFWLKMMKNANCKTVNLSKQHVLHRLHSNSNFNTKTFDIQSMIKKYK